MTEHEPERVCVPSMQDLLDWLEDRLDAGRRTAIEAAIALGEPGTVERLEWVRAFRRQAALLPLVTPPPALSRRLRQLADRAADEPRAPRQVVARITIDSRRVTRPVGVRGPHPADPVHYQLVFEADKASVIIDVMPDGPGTVALRGHVIADPDTPSLFWASVRTPSGIAVRRSGDETGVFRLDHVPIESDRLLVDNDVLAVSIPLDLALPTP